MERPPSPCIKVCVLTGSRCSGCLRTIDEIAGWSAMSAEQQWAVIAALENRRKIVADDVINRINTHIGTRPAALFMTRPPHFPQCGLSAQAKKFSNWPTYPQLYVGGELVGGCDIVLDMHRSGELQKLLTEAGATA